MASKSKITIYTDGSDFTWAFIGIDSDGAQVATAVGEMEGVKATTDNDHTEARAIFEAAKWASKTPGNYVLITDSKMIIEKIRGNCNDCTKNPDIVGARRLIDAMNSTPMPTSFRLVWRERLSNEYMVTVDAMAGGKKLASAGDEIRHNTVRGEAIIHR
jgi:ribonuclease HI